MKSCRTKILSDNLIVYSRLRWAHAFSLLDALFLPSSKCWEVEMLWSRIASCTSPVWQVRPQRLRGLLQIYTQNDTHIALFMTQDDRTFQARRVSFACLTKCVVVSIWSNWFSVEKAALRAYTHFDASPFPRAPFAPVILHWHENENGWNSTVHTAGAQLAAQLAWPGSGGHRQCNAIIIESLLVQFIVPSLLSLWKFCRKVALLSCSELDFGGYSGYFFGPQAIKPFQTRLRNISPPCYRD